jgi:hypothetical protein
MGRISSGVGPSIITPTYFLAFVLPLGSTDDFTSRPISAGRASKQTLSTANSAHGVDRRGYSGRLGSWGYAGKRAKRLARPMQVPCRRS